MDLYPEVQKLTPKSKVDRISSLPDDVLSQILSLIPTKYAVATTILSKRWRNVWTYVSDLDIDFIPRRVYSASSFDVARFVRFVDRVFHPCNSSRIRKIRLHCKDYKLKRSHVSSWINEAVRRNVEVLDTNLYDLELPLSFFTSKTLRDLRVRLGPYDVMNYPPSICLPCLKILHITCNYHSEDLSDKLFCSCPVLEELCLGTIVGQSCEKSRTYNVSTTTLKRLEISLHVPMEDEELAHKVIINAPNLEYLYLEDNFLAEYILEDVSSLFEAKVSIGSCISRDCDREAHNPEYHKRVFKLLRAIGGVEFLSLNTRTIGCIDFPDAYDLPTFHSMTWLEVVIHDFCGHELFGWTLLPKIFEISPNLEALYLKKEQGYLYSKFFANEEESFWHESLPNCFRSLEEIEITGFVGNRYEVEVLEYLLGNAEVLERLTIKCRSLSIRNEEANFYAKLLKLPRASSDCQIEFL